MLAIIDTRSCESLCIEVDNSLSGTHVVRELDRLWEQGRHPVRTPVEY